MCLVYNIEESMCLVLKVVCL